MIFQDAKLNEVLELLELYNIGAVPVVDDQGRVIDLYRYVLILGEEGQPPNEK